MTSILIIATLFLGTAILTVPFAQKKKLGSVMGYLLAGVIIGALLRLLAPALGFVDSKTIVEELNHITEFGVVIMLFLIGLEMRPSQLWQMKGSIFGLGGLQVGLTTLFISLFLVSFFDLHPFMSIALGLTMALSSTAIIMQTLNEKRLMQTQGGQTSFSVLLFQDIAVIPIIALLPFLKNLPQNFSSASHGPLDISHFFPGWAQPLMGLVAVFSVYFLARYLVRPLFRYIAQSNLREIFSIAALALVALIASLMSLFNLSPALGVFIAGVILSESEYRHELESNLEPFKGLLLGLFFMTVGAAFDFGLLKSQWLLIISLTLGLIGLKFFVLWFLGRLFKLEKSQNLLFALALAQGGEFAFVLSGVALNNAVIDAQTSSLLKIIVALSMALTPFLFLIYEKLFFHLTNKNQTESIPDVIDEKNKIIVAGFGRFGQILVRLLASSGYKATVLDHDPHHIESLRKFGWKVYYGDATRMDLLEAAGIEKACMLIIALDDGNKTIELVENVRRLCPDIPILARAQDRRVAYELINRGVTNIVRDTFESSLFLGQKALQQLGMNEKKAQEARQKFADMDRQAVRELAEVWKQDEEAYVDIARHNQHEIEAMLKKSLAEFDK